MVSERESGVHGDFFSSLLMALERPLSIERLVRRVFSLLQSGSDADAMPRRQVTSEAFCHARRRLGVEPVKKLFEIGAAKVKPAPSFCGWRLWALDTMDQRVPDTRANVRHFGRPGSSNGPAAFPQIGASVLLDVANRRVREIVLGDVTDSERSVALELVKPLGRGDLVLQDRGLAAVWVFEQYALRGVDYVTRIPEGWKPKVIQSLGPGEFIIELTGIRPVFLRKGERAGRLTTIRARLIEYRLGKRSRVRVITSIPADVGVGARKIARLYHSRWDIEIAFDEIKTHLATVPHGTMRTVFRSKTPEGVVQESYGLFAAYNLIRELIVEASAECGRKPREISFVAAVDLIRWALASIQGSQYTHVAAMLSDIARCRMSRPRRRRTYPRVVRAWFSRYPVKKWDDLGGVNRAFDKLRLLETKVESRITT